MTDTTVTKKRITAKWRTNALSFAMGFGATACIAIGSPISYGAAACFGKFVLAATGSPELGIFAGLGASCAVVLGMYGSIAYLYLGAPKKQIAVAGLVASMTALFCVPDRVWDQFPVTREMLAIGKTIGQMNTRMELRTGAVDPSPKP